MRKTVFVGSMVLSFLFVFGWAAVHRADGAPLVLSETGFFNTPGTSEAVAVSGDYAYVADGYLGLRIIDVSDPAAPSETGFYNTSGYAYDVAVSGDYAYVADGSKGLRVINITNPASPTETGYYDVGSGSSRGVALSGDLAYVADSNGGLQIIDVGSPGSPSLEGCIDTPGSAYGVAVSSLYAFVADQYNGLTIINISNPTSPVEIGNFNTSGQAYAVGLYSQYACVADYNRGLRIIDVSNPAVPVETGFYDPAVVKYYRDIAIVGQWAFVASDASSTDGSNGLRVIDLTDPSAPSEEGYCDAPGDPKGVTVHGKYAYLAAGGSGLRIIDIAPLLTNYVYYVPYYNGDWDNYWTGLGIRNESTDESASVCVTVRESNGTMVRNEFLTPIPARGQNSFMVAPDTGQEGWFQLSANQPLAGLCFVGHRKHGTLKRDVMFDIPFVKELSKFLYIPHVAQYDLWNTTLMICNPGGTAAQVTLTFVQNDGTALTPLIVSIPARGSGKYEVASLTGGKTYDKGSIEISSDQGIAAFALYQDTEELPGGGYNCAGISAVRPQP